jgi:hypothetical protein
VNQLPLPEASRPAHVRFHAPPSPLVKLEISGGQDADDTHPYLAAALDRFERVAHRLDASSGRINEIVEILRPRFCPLALVLCGLVTWAVTIAAAFITGGLSAVAMLAVRLGVTGAFRYLRLKRRRRAAPP